MTDLIILATLLEGPKHGYQLKKEAGLIFGHGAIHNNLVYPLLRRFTKEGWVSKKTVPGERGQDKQQYVMTPAGRKSLVEQLSRFDEQDARSIGAFRLRVALSPLLSPEVREAILDGRESALQQQDSRLRELETRVQHSFYPEQVIRFARTEISQELAWIGRLRKHQKQERKES
jgi:DNA-binding PadR family transcriptional regulator